MSTARRSRWISALAQEAREDREGNLAAGAGFPAFPIFLFKSGYPRIYQLTS
jgi:hypothetical protein